METLKNVSKISTHMGKITISLILYTCFTHFIEIYISGKPFNYIQLICQIILIITIFIWIYAAPKYCENIRTLKDIFPSNHKYCILCEKYMNQWVYLKLKTSINFSPGKILRIFYYVIWWGSWTCSMIILFMFDFIPCDYTGILTAILMFISIRLNYSSYYLSLIFVYFLQKVSLLNDLEYNKYLPSTTWGLQKLFFQARKGSTIFLTVTLLYTIFYTFLIFLGIQTSNTIENINKYPKSFLFLIISLFIIGFLTYILIFIAPKILLSNLHKHWKEKSIKALEKELYNAEQNNDDRKIDILINRIYSLQKDKFIHQFNISEILLTLSTLLINIINIYNFLENIINLL